MKRKKIYTLGKFKLFWKVRKFSFIVKIGRNNLQDQIYWLKFEILVLNITIFYHQEDQKWYLSEGFNESCIIFFITYSQFFCSNNMLFDSLFFSFPVIYLTSSVVLCFIFFCIVTCWSKHNSESSILGFHFKTSLPK